MYRKANKFSFLFYFVHSFKFFFSFFIFLFYFFRFESFWRFSFGIFWNMLTKILGQNSFNCSFLDIYFISFNIVYLFIFQYILAELFRCNSFSDLFLFIYFFKSILRNHFDIILAKVSFHLFPYFANILVYLLKSIIKNACIFVLKN